MPKALALLTTALLLGTGCCLESAGDGSSAAAATSSGTSAGTTGGGSSTGGASSGGGSTGVSSYVGAIEVEALVTVGQELSATPMVSSLTAVFQSGRDWPACTSDSFVDQGNPCCYAPGPAIMPGLSAGVLTETVELPTDGIEQANVAFSFDRGTYDAEDLPTTDAGAWFSKVSASGDVIPAFTVYGALFPPPEPVLTPDLGSLSSLSTSQDWTVPLTPSEFEYLFYDRVILHVDGVGTIYCQVTDEGVLRPDLIVPAGLLANFAGHQGRVSIYRDDYTGFVDAGSNLLVGYRAGKGIRTGPQTVTFTP